MLIKNLNKDIRILLHLLQKRIKCAISSISPESQCIQIRFDNGILGAWCLPVSIAKGRQPPLILAITHLLPELMFAVTYPDGTGSNCNCLYKTSLPPDSEFESVHVCN